MRNACLCLLSIAWALAACSSTQQASVAKAATSPLSDLNVVQAEIPQLLRAAKRAPYAMPVDRSCDALAADIAALDVVLGPDLDAPRSKDSPSLLERGTTAAGNEAVGALKGAAEDVVPFRHWVRQLTGAERYSSKVAAAIIAGTERRAFMKGLRAAQDCPTPVPVGSLSPETSTELP